MTQLYKKEYNQLRRYYLIILESLSDDEYYINLMKEKLKELDERILNKKRSKLIKLEFKLEKNIINIHKFPTMLDFS